MNHSTPSENLSHESKVKMIRWGLVLVIWFLALCIIPDPRPLGAPDWAVDLVRSASGLSEPSARAVTTIALRGLGMGVIGILFALFLTPVQLKFAAPIAILGSGMLCIVSQWINYGYFPIAAQSQLAWVSAVLGALLGLVLRRSWISLAALVLVAGGLFIWGTSTGISDDLYRSASLTGQHILDHADEIKEGDEGFAQLLQEAFTFAEDNSHGTDAIEPNKAAILALGVILGEERIASVTNRPLDWKRKKEFAAIRRRVTVQGRNDLVRHFWVSAALTILSDESRSMTVGITKELMDATEGGSGFSFVDLTADRAGTLLANVATQTPESARRVQIAIRKGVSNDDYFPAIEGLPEGLSRDKFQDDYGGLGGTKTNQIVEDIRSRLAKCRGLQQDD